MAPLAQTRCKTCDVVEPLAEARCEKSAVILSEAKDPTLLREHRVDSPARLPWGPSLRSG
jgi:hypothetical protein